MAAIKELVGDSLVNCSGQTVDTSSLADKLSSESFGKRVLGLYFSAHWCPPCRDFSPVLIKFYNHFKNSAASAYCLVDIVFISSDNDEESFVEYLKEMPWLAIPYSERQRKVSVGQNMSVTVHYSVFILIVERY